MQARDLLLPVVAACCAVTFTWWSAHHILADMQRDAAEPAPMLLSVGSREVIGSHPSFLGDSQAPNTLVEFADYQCVPCGEMSRELPDLLAPFSKQIRFTFRNLPLPSLHKQAAASALAAEAARLQGCFWPVHDALFRHQSDLSRSALLDIISRQAINRHQFDADCATTARMALEEDVRCADRLRLTSTPAFVLCCADGRIVRLGSIHQLREYVK